ncbi:VPLPA-CTERM-specific exosortase XrtD [Ramlibacter ginsenosidimutans]|uniref:VPLPA-CTERM-specific exosortase XrtD n=1 Tax=Ramlibacter ginsenosidimutans TaxID=502333 RepID=A0A934TPL5_9BURK|nr:VPLPA-CTERM-specific exosortase XrtD [Ramlibacter ginsenosidimutans]MBK6005157.1 VPLPA-CTERM-specific exosortase XrtD [Ramlibacter ginsenosidimutans]
MAATPPIPVLSENASLPGRASTDSGRTLAHRPGLDEALLALGIVAAFLACFGGLAELALRWHRQEEYSHGYFIPLISLWLLWSRREALVQSRGEPSRWGIAVLALAAASLLLGELTALMLLIQLAFLLSLAGLVLCYGGSSMLRITLLPIAVLLFSVPMPYLVESQLTWRLQLVSSNLGVAMLRAFNYSVYLEGNVIDLGSFKLQVIEACSGLRYLYPLLSVGFLMAYMYPAALRWRVLLMLSTIPITVFTNSIRIAVTGVLVDQWGSGMANGFLHYFEGWIIFIACQVVLTLEIMAIERFTRRRSLFEVQQFPQVQPVPPSGAGPARAAGVLSAAVLLLLLAFIAVHSLDVRDEIRPARTSLRLFPSELEGWSAREASMPVDVERALGLEDYVLADYVGPASESVNFYVAYYASQRKGVSPHSPQVCIPGGGWVISDLRNVQVPAGDDTELTAVRVQVDRGRERALVYYWFQERGERLANEYAVKWHLLVDAVLRNRTDGALVRVMTEVAPNEDTRAADARLQRFVRAAAPKLGPFVPD